MLPHVCDPDEGSIPEQHSAHSLHSETINTLDIPIPTLESSTSTASMETATATAYEIENRSTWLVGYYYSTRA